MPRGDNAGNRPVYLWVAAPGGTSFHRLAAGAGEIDRHCEALVEALRRYDREDESWVEPASWLYEQTIAPVADRLRGVKRLIIVGDGALCTIPFDVFVAGRDAHSKRYIKHHLLIENFAVAYAPSATLLDSVSRRPRPGKWDYSLWAFASTRFKDGGASSEPEPDSSPKSYKDVLRSARSMSLDDLPRTASEVRAVARGFGSEAVKVFVDEPNMKETLLRAAEAGTLRSVRFLHFATHAVTDPGRPYLSGLVLCPPYASQPPDRADRHSSPGRLPDGSDRLPGGSDPLGPPSCSAPPCGRRPCGQDAAHKGRRYTLSPLGKGGFRGVAGLAQEHKPGSPALPHRAKRSRRPELLTVGELTELDLTSELVVLSACHSLGREPVEGDWLNGLTRAFLVAGSSGVICTTMDTADQAALVVVSTLYYELITPESGTTRGADSPLKKGTDSEPNASHMGKNAAGRGACPLFQRTADVPTALQEIKRSFLRSRKHGHPSIWAPWVYHGRVFCD